MSSVVPLTQSVTSGDAAAVSAALAGGADVNERNNGGQTALILAVIFGHKKLVRMLVDAGANPRLRDNLGLDAIEWAQRRGFTEAIQIFGSDAPAPAPPIRPIRVEEDIPMETPVNTDEKSRKWLAGVKQRIQEREQARKETVVAQPAPIAKPEPVPTVEPAPQTSSARKRCPKCNAIYDSELLAYCAHHVVPLVDVDAETSDDDAPLFQQPQSTSITATPLLWTFILVTVALAAFTGYLITTQLSRVVIPDTPAAATPQQPLGVLKGAPAATGELTGKAVQLAEAECPVFENDSRPSKTHTVNVHIKLDKTGKVFWARAEGGDEPLRRAATEAAIKSTFSAEKLRNRETQGTITYTFTP
ncbi:MAG TPA: ankyrin repeat domain-containing protein [Pyrinomonadaceae bacterium]|nr:ankyrin repeat domain-containing protein [Pyrinomonadaceae bacterium]